MRLRLQGRLVRPAFVAFRIAQFAPVIDGFGDDEDRRAGALEDIADRMLKAWPDAAIGFRILEADEAGDRIAGGRVEPPPPLPLAPPCR